MTRRYVWLMIVITLAAAFLRLWRLAEVPPGLHYDLAATALLGNDVAFGGYRPIFISAYTGHEPLFYYWLAGWFRLIGSSVFALRLAAALLGVLAVPAAFFAIRQALRFEEAAPALAALGAALLAIAFFHLAFSRFGFRVIIQPVVQALALGFLFRGLWRWAAGHKAQGARLKVQGAGHKLQASIRRFLSIHGDILLAGFFTGLAAYTYLAARLFPVPLAIFWIALLAGSWRQARLTASNHATRITDHASPPDRGFKPLPPSTHGTRNTQHFTLFTLTALLTFAPLGLYFLRHPEDFLNRAGQVAPRPGEGALLLQGVRRAAEMIFISGEPYERYNLPGLPLFGPVLGFFFVIGLLITARNALWPGGAGARDRAQGAWVVEQEPLRRATELLLLAWVPAMLVPTALAVHDVFPSNLRAFGLIPLLFVFPARGLFAAYRWLQRRAPGPLIPLAYPLVVLTLVVLALGGWSTYRNYFDRWAGLPNQRLNNDADLTAIAEYLNAQDLAGTRTHVSAIHYRHPTLAYLARDFSALDWLTGGTSLAIPAEGPALYLFARSAPPPESWIAGWAPFLDAAPADPDNVPAFRAYRFAAGQRPPLPDFTPADENFANVIRLSGYQVLTETNALLVDLRWQVQNLPEAGDYLPYARLYDPLGLSVSQSGGFSYPSEQWQPGDTLLTRLSVPLPAGLPPADYTLKVGVYSANQQASLPRLDPAGAYAGERAALPSLALAGPPQATPADLQAENSLTPPARLEGFAGPLKLLGYDLNTLTPRQGERLLLTLYWQAAGPAPAQALTLELGGETAVEAVPGYGAYPFDRWPAGQVLVDRHSVRVPHDAPAGPAELAVSVPGQGRAVLAALDVQPVARSFAPPQVAVISGAAFSAPDVPIVLHGYTLVPGPTTTLSLAWHAPRGGSNDYTVFVHVLAEGQLVAQADQAPRGGSYPTSLWAPGEYITDDYAFDLPPGRYTLELGLYAPETGARLRLDTGTDAVVLPAFEVR